MDAIVIGGLLVTWLGFAAREERGKRREERGEGKGKMGERREKVAEESFGFVLLCKRFIRRITDIKDRQTDA